MPRINPNKQVIFTVDFETVKEAKLNLQASKLKIIGRLYYIYKTIASSFGKRISWTLDDCDIDDFDVEDFNNSRDGVYCWYNAPGDSLCEVLDEYCKALIVYNGKKNEHNFSDGGFPIRWMFEAFEDELKKGIKEYNSRMKQELEEEKARQEQIRKSKQDRKKIIASVKKKLTPEEIEVVFGG